MSLEKYLPGIVLMLLTVLLFSIMNALAKSFTLAFPIIEIVWGRYASQTIFTIIIFSPNLGKVLATNRLKIHLFRSALLFGATLFMFAGFKYLNLVTTITIFQVGPLIVVIFSVMFLQESVSLKRWMSVFIGFCGALLIIKPGTNMFLMTGILPLLAATCYAGYAVSTRNLGTEEDPRTNFLYTSLVGTIISSALLIPFFKPISLVDASSFCILGLLGGLGHFCFVLALRKSEASLLAPFTYFDLIFASILGIIFFSEYPDVYVLLGAIIIVTAGIYLWRRENIER